MKSSLKHLEVLVAQQSKDFQQLSEQLGQLNVPSVLAELKRLALMPRVFGHVKDSTSQTSPPLAQSLHLTRQDEEAPEEPVTGQIQALPTAWNVRMDSLKPGDFAVWGEGAKNAALQEEVMLLAAGGGKRNRQVRDKAVQTHCKNQLTTKTGSENHGASIPVSQEALQLIPLDLNNFANGIKDTCQKPPAKDMFPCNPSEPGLVTEQKGRVVERGGKGKQTRPRKTRRSRPPARKQRHTPSTARIFHSKCPEPPVSGSQKSPPEEQEPLAQPLHQQRCPSSPTESACTILGGPVTPRKRERAAQGDLLQPGQHSSQENSLQRDHQISWFSDLNLEKAQSPLCKKPGKSVLYDLGFDSSEDSF